MNKSVIFHDYFETTDGGSRLAMILARELKAMLVCAFIVPNHPYLTVLPPYQIKTFFPYLHIPFLRQLAMILLFLRRYPHFNRYDTAIFSGSYAPLAAVRNKSRLHLYYCHTPPRFLYDLKEHFQNRIPSYLRPSYKLFMHYYKHMYEKSIDYMDVIIANSMNVKSRIKSYLNKNSIIIYPPCDTRQFSYMGQAGFFLSAARLDPLKRVDKIIKAFAKLLHKRLIVVSGGPDKNRIERLAHKLPNVTVLGPVDEPTFIKLMGTCIASIYIPYDEDFGMVPVESMAAGKPVIGVREGGVMESVIDGETGILLDPDPHLEDIIRAVEWMTPQRALSMRKACERRACQFDTSIFMQRIENLITQLLENVPRPQD